MATRFIAKGYGLEPGVFSDVAPIGVDSSNNLTFSPDGTTRTVLASSGGIFSSTAVTIRVGDGSAAVPSYSFANDTDTGLLNNYAPANFGIGVVVNGTERVRLGDGSGTAYGLLLANSGHLAWQNVALTPNAVGTVDLFLLRDAADTLAQRRGTNGQTLRVYKTYTDASNYERLAFNVTGTNPTITTEAAGTGTLRELILNGSGVNFATSSNVRWYVSASGHFLSNSDNAYDIGAVGTAPRYIYARTGLVALSGANAGSVLVSPSDGVLRLTDYAGTAFSRLQFGGTTSSFPALRRSSTTLQVYLADDSAHAGLECGVLQAAAGTATPAGGSTAGRITIGSAAVGHYIGTGAPTVSAAKGSIYVRTDATTTTTRMYINTDGGTTWTNFTTAA